MRMLFACLAVAIVTVLVGWGGWFFVGSVSSRIAVESLLQWGILATFALTALQFLSIRIGGRLSLPMIAPLVAGIIAALGAGLLAQFGMSLPIPFWAAAGVALVATLVTQLHRFGRVAAD